MKFLFFIFSILLVTGCVPNASDKILAELQSLQAKRDAEEAAALRKRDRNIQNMTQPFDPVRPLGDPQK